ncbi:hypothetical protein ECC02_006904 [Trypanosoma cruzi]|uniref:Uncharacterized protein n=1 Tax=Trypanosoma cruzi TaxID=5693 RepID=A0A7J6Y1U7_TRYCR|nr:hypothetical protein ECC02_006904 [Trypanosoma cruzi]
MDGSIGGKLTPPQFIRAGVFMRRPIHREGNGGPFLLRCTAGSTVATCVHRIGHMAHSTQLTIPATHAHIKATEITVLMLSLSTGSRTLLPRTHTHTHAIDQAAVTLSTRHIHRHNHRKGDSGCALTPSFLLFMATEEEDRRHTQLPACTAKEAFKSTAMCILCVCACRNTKQRSRKESRVCGGTHKMYSGVARLKQQERRSNT